MKGQKQTGTMNTSAYFFRASVGRRMTAILLVFAMFLTFSSAAAFAVDGRTGSAEDYPYEIGMVRIQVQNDFRYERILKDEAGHYYFSAETIEAFTGYHLDTERSAVEWILQKYQVEFEHSYNKTIRINYTDKIACLKEYSVDLPGLPVCEGQVWLPIAEIMPMLDTVLYVEDGTLYMDQPKVSLVDALGNLPIRSLYFDAAKEFDGKSWANAVQVESAFWYETFKGVKINKLLPEGHIEDYEAAFIDYLTDRDVYETALKYDEWKNSLESFQTFAKGLKKDYGLAMDSLKLIYHFAEKLDMISDRYGPDGYFVNAFYERLPEDVYAGMKEFGAVLKCAVKAADYAINMALMVEDNYSMLRVVYPEVESIKLHVARSSEEDSNAINDAYHVKTKIAAAKKVYKAYSSSDAANITNSFLKDLFGDLSADAFNEIMVKSAFGIDPIAIPAAKLTGAVVDEFLKELGIGATKDLARLNHHIILENDALDTYNYYVTHHGESYDWETLNNIRLSAIMTLLSAKRCFEIIRDNNSLNSEVVSYCNNKIDLIAPYLAKLYLAAEGVLTDGADFMAQETAELQDTLKDLVLFTEDPVMAIYGKWFRENMPEDRINNDYVYLADVTGDGVLDMIVTHYGDEGFAIQTTLYEHLFNQGDYDYDHTDYYGEGIFMQIYTIYEDSVSLIYEQAASFTHLGWSLQLLCKNGAGYAILDVINTEYQEEKTIGYTVYAPANDGSEVLTPGNYFDNGDRRILSSKYCEDGTITDSFKKELINLLNGATIILNTQYPDYLVAGTSTYASWFEYQEFIKEPADEDETDSSSGAEDETDITGDGEDDPSGFDLVREYSAEALTEGLWITTFDGSNTLWLTFEGTADDLSMRYGITEWNTDYTCPVKFERSGEQFIVDDGRAISRSMPEFYQTGYRIVYDYEDGSLRLNLSSGDSLIFEDIG